MRRLVILAAVVIVVLVFGVGQLVLPGIAAQRVRDQLAHSGDVRSVSVHAFPAIELLWHHADRVVISMGSYRSTSGKLGSSLGQSSDVGSLQGSASEVSVGLLALRNASLAKSGNQLFGRATVTDADLRAALPILQSVTLVGSENGAVTFQGTATLFGVSATVQATARAQNGQLVVTPNVPLGGLATITVFSDPHVSVQSVSATAVPGGFSMTATGVLK
jgi:hypothetical protein